MSLKKISLLRRGLLISGASALASACRPVRILNAVIPTQSMHIVRDIPFGSSPRQSLDIYQPAQMPAKLLPVVLFFYGGSWDSGSKLDYLFVAEALVSQGFVVVIADYRIYPEIKFPQLMDDPALSVQWVKKHIASYGGNPEKLFLMGHSAGAHLAVMLSVNPQYLTNVGLVREDIQGTIGLAGPYDFLPLTSDRLRAIFAPPSEEWRSQPICFVDGFNSPLLLLAGMKDNTVWPRNSIRLASAITAKGGQVSLRTYSNYDHVDMVAKLAKPLRGNSTLRADIVDWMHRHGG